MKIPIVVSLFLFICCTSLFGQETVLFSKNEIETQRALYKQNKVKEVTLNDGQMIYVTKIDKEGKPTETTGIYDKQKVASISFKYDRSGNMIESSYFGLVSGDYMEYIYIFDLNGNVIEQKELWGYEEEGASSYTIGRYKYDDHGNLKTVIDSEGNESVFYQYLNGRKSESFGRCNEHNSEVEFKKFFYDANGLLIKEEIYSVDCKTGKEKFSQNIEYTYNDKGLIQKIESKFEKKLYSYKYY